MKNKNVFQNSTGKNIPAPKIITFNPDSDQYQCLIDREKDKVGFHSGFVTILPGSKGELHSTKEYEEMIIVLKGEAQLNLTDHNNLRFRFGQLAYVPPYTEHQVENIGRENLKYIYVVAKSKLTP